MQSQEFLNAVAYVLIKCYGFSPDTVWRVFSTYFSKSKMSLPAVLLLYVPTNVSVDFVYEQIFAKYCEIARKTYRLPNGQGVVNVSK